MNGQILIVSYFLLLLVCIAVGAVFGKALGARREKSGRFLLGGLLVGGVLLFPLALLMLGF